MTYVQMFIICVPVCGTTSHCAGEKAAAKQLKRGKIYVAYFSEILFTKFSVITK